METADVPLPPRHKGMGQSHHDVYMPAEHSLSPEARRKNKRPIKRGDQDEGQ